MDDLSSLKFLSVLLLLRTATLSDYFHCSDRLGLRCETISCSEESLTQQWLLFLHHKVTQGAVIMQPHVPNLEHAPRLTLQVGSKALILYMKTSNCISSDNQVWNLPCGIGTRPNILVSMCTYTSKLWYPKSNTEYPLCFPTLPVSVHLWESQLSVTLEGDNPKLCTHRHAAISTSHPACVFCRKQWDIQGLLETSVC